MDNKPNHEHHYNSLEFYVTCYTNFGQELRICGNSMQTGNWNPFLGHKLITDDSIYPQWRSVVPLIIRNNNKLEFKACVVSPNKTQWQRNIPNRQILTEQPSILKFVFDEMSMSITHKKITQIDCRQGTFQIIDEMESSQSSSIQFKTNYPLEYYFQNDISLSGSQNRKHSDGQLSSNLFSQCAQNIEKMVYQSTEQKQRQFQTVNIKLVGCPQLLKSHSIKSKTMVRRSDQRNRCLQIPNRNKLGRARSKSKSLQKSQSDSKSKKQQPQSPIQVHVPQVKQNQRNQKSAKKPITPIIQNSEQDNCLNSKQDQKNSECNSTSTNKQYDTEAEDQYFYTRDQDVVLQSQFSQV